MTEALLGFGAVFLLALLRVPLAFAMGFVGFIALGLMRGWGPTAASAAQVVYDTGFAYTLSVVPLFILMGNFVAKAGLAHELFRAAYAFIGHVRGGLAHATVLACAGFGAICGPPRGGRALAGWAVGAAARTVGQRQVDADRGLCGRRLGLPGRRGDRCSHAYPRGFAIQRSRTMSSMSHV